MFYDRTVLGYHGCDTPTAEALLAGQPFLPSKNRYDWLGKGVYFWEFGPDRALRFATFQLARRAQSSPPSVVGALLQLGRCFNLLDTRFTQDLAQGFLRYKKFLRRGRVPLPTNKGKTPDLELRLRDCAVLNWYLDALEEEGTYYDTVRGGFVEGGPAFPGAGIQKETHLQVAVRNPACILGVFRPRRTS